MFYTQASAYEGEPVRLYRTPMEIRRDIAEINEKITKADGRLNIRVLLGELMTEYGEGDPEDWLPELARLGRLVAHKIDLLLADHTRKRPRFHSLHKLPPTISLPSVESQIYRAKHPA